MKLSRSLWVLVGVLVFIEQGIKVVINRSYLTATTPLLEPYLYFSPTFNRDYSWLNSMFQLNVGRFVHILLVAMLLALAYLFYRFLQQQLVLDGLSLTAFAFLFAGAICSLTDKVVWDGSLDYIQLRGFFTFDLKDVYINVFTGLFVLMMIINHRGIRMVKEDEVLRDFWRFISKR